MKYFIDYNNEIKMFIFQSPKAISTREFNLLLKELCHEIYHNFGDWHQIGRNIKITAQNVKRRLKWHIK